ncbi:MULTISPECIES: Nramp family divalent metal transporter [Carnobacterium]|uniref:Nramp family divalent metal transporter n=1 Tax=Carnobacterium TaxID=2747 RepID=UPI0007F331A9|nr:MULTISPECIES: Nramp family divalent metal transporter [Carnobacterium]MCO6017520.1 Nramp family divalent metal transporter [Carnobacterium divergens]MDT1939113.1 Nramp family divalent metal transporter [Carnobacterium divergens]MDT1941551.1 Nramp family divalent metal transporter [Carnobacterium divergens]MDT1947349.1 Nramp family divalent metal transporter [Carnobacterium divergens]MDT1949788.1 Nramp family divalent metal transporter [Carnobacterium divergens]
MSLNQNKQKEEKFGKRVAIPKNASSFRKLLAFMGPGALIAVGYVDPGNWATSIAGGSSFGYLLLSVILLSNLMAVLLQSLSAKLGIATEKDLAELCRDEYGQKRAILLWVLAQLAIIATDLAEVIGAAIALKLLFGIPLLYGVLITSLDILLLLFLQHKGFQWIERIVITLMTTIFICFAIELFLSKPEFREVMVGFLPHTEVVTNPKVLYLALGILGATVMPHNLYLHSSIVQSRAYERTPAGKKEATKFAFLDSTINLTFALLINSAILILAAATFYKTGQYNVVGIEDTYQLLNGTLGSSIASTLFAVALLASGQNSTLTGTMAGQIIMEGFLHLKIPAWLSRLGTRLFAIVPAVIVTIIAGQKGTDELLLLSQVVLSMQLPFAIFPLIQFTSNERLMGELKNGKVVNGLAWFIGLLITGLNLYLLTTFF